MNTGPPIGAHWEREAAARLPDLLREWLGEPLELWHSDHRVDRGVDLTAITPGPRLFIQVKGTDDIASLERADATLRRLELNPSDLPLLVVPYMGPRARAWAREAGVSWADLSGNADIRGPGLRILVQGAENRYAHPGRPGNPFAPKYARVTRALLAEPERWWRQKELCAEIGLSDGTISRAVSHLRTAELLESNPEGALRPRDPSVLLDAWAQRYEFTGHRVSRFYRTARSGLSLLRGLAEGLSQTGCTWAATGLSAAYMYTQHADFRLTTVFVDQLPKDPASLGLHPVEQGENVWLVEPDDEGVFYRRQERGVWCAHPVQVYLDLLSQPERAAEARAHLRAELLRWRAS